MNTIPSLPRLDGDPDIFLDIFSHHSLPRHPWNVEYGDKDRLALLGGDALNMALSAHFFYKQPLLTADQVKAEMEMAVTDAKLHDWLSAWNIPAKYHAAPNALNLLESPDDMRYFFKSFLGALYVRNGLGHVQAFVSALIDPNVDASSLTAPPPPPPIGKPPPLPQGMPAPHSHAAAPTMPPQTVTLAWVNQTAMQRGFAVTYPAAQTGPPHAPTWTVSCEVNGIKKGEGVGKSQKIAKEEAARRAAVAMSWVALP